MGILTRVAAAFALLTATFNPTDWNYARWVQSAWTEQPSVAVLVGLLLLVGYVIFLRATFRSIGAFGMLLVVALFAALVWVLFDFGFLSLENPTFNTWLALMALSLVLGIGLSWSIVRRRLSGQADVDDVDE